MSEAVLTQAKEGLTAPVKALKAAPVKFLVGTTVILAVVVLIELFYPGAITGRIRRVFTAVGVKGAA